MSEGLAARAKELFLEVLELPEAERAARLERLAAEEPALLERVRALLAAHAGSTGLGLPSLPRLLEAVGAGTSEEALAVGARVGDYEILGEIGRGGGGTVYRARQLHLERVVALKVLRRARRGEAVERFRAEAEAVARLDDPNIVPVYEVGEHEGRHFFSMKWVEGESLAAALRSGPLPARVAARLVARVARAVHHAHQRGFLHCDLKPSNVLIDEASTPFVADFGIARRLDEKQQGDGRRSGTPAYMAPEQAVAGGELSVGTDVHALGAILFEAVSGHAAFEGSSISAILARVSSEPAPPLSRVQPGTPPELAAIVARCLAKDPADRYPSANALAQDLDRWLAFEPVDALPAGPLERLRLFWLRRPLVANLVLLVLLLVLALAIGGTWASVRLGDSLERALGAEAQAKDRLRASFLAQARAKRLTHLPGRAVEGLALLEEAARIRPGADVRDEAIACLALTDLYPVDTWGVPEGGTGIAAHDSPRDRWAVALRDGRVLLREGEAARYLPPVVGQAWRLSFSPDGVYLLAKYHRSEDESVARFRVWEVASGREALALDVLVPGSAARFSPAGDLLAVASSDGGLRLFAVPGFEELAATTTRPVRDLAFRPDGGLLAAIEKGEDAVALLSLPGLEPAGSIPCPAPPRAAAWSPEGERLLVAAGAQSAYVLDVAGEHPPVVFTEHQSEVVGVWWRSESELVASYSWDETTRLWNARSGKELVALSAQALDFTRDGERLGFVSNEELGYYAVLREDVVREIHAHEGKSPLDVEASPDGRWLASAGPDGLYLWEVPSLRPLGRPLATSVRDVVFDPRGGALVASGPEGLWRLDYGPGSVDAGDLRAVRLREGGWHKLAVSSSGTFAASGDDDLLVFDPRRPEEGRVLPGLFRMDTVALTPDAGLLAVGNWQGRGVALFDPATGREVRTLEDDRANVEVTFSPDGEWLVTARGDRYAFRGTRDLEVEREHGVGLEHSRRPGAVAFREDGEVAVLSVSYTSFQLLDPRTGDSLATFEPPDPFLISDFEFVPGTDLLAVSTMGNRIQVWDLGRLQEELDRRGLAYGRSLLAR